MTNLLFEITTYDIPYDLQTKAEEDLKSLLTTALNNLQVDFSLVVSFSTNRRIVLYIDQITEEIKPITTIKKGPSVNASSEILEKFLTSNNVNLESCYKEKTAKGEFFFIKQTTKGDLLKNRLADIITKNVLSKIAFKRSMFWNSSKIKWARPITNLVLMLGKEVIDFSFAELQSSSCIKGHMFLSEETVTLAEASEYFKVITDLKVVLPAYKKDLQQLKAINNSKILNFLTLSREEIIINEVNDFANKNNLIPNLSQNLITELLYLSEYPVVLLGEIPEKYLILPKELLVNTMVKNQRYVNFFSANGDISKHFVIVANINGADGGLEIIKGNQKVLDARLEDGLFFYNLDLKEDWNSKEKELQSITFFEGLGNMLDKQERLKKLATVFFPADNLERLCNFSKVDLSSKVVGEFPELQGTMGSYYALNNGFSQEEALAIREQYMPLSSNGELPSTNLGAKLAFLDKIDTLISFFAIGKAPTSSSDPFALRRAALGVIRICAQYSFNINLSDYLENKLLEFFSERLIIYLNSLGVQKDITIAVLNKNELDITEVSNKALVLKEFLGQNSDLIILFKRVFNILNSVEKQENEVNSSLLEQKEEKSLFNELTLLQQNFAEFFTSNKANSAQQYNNYVKALITVKPLLDSFLNNTLIINKNMPELTKNRLALLNLILQALQKLGNLELINI